jgi:PHD/YefM family antitoxin component YafN of YafNO toxin-antitoxin module
MNTIPASEIKRRGTAVLEENLKNGPVHIIKNNRPLCVVLSEQDYAALLQQTRRNEESNLWELLDYRPWEGTRSKKNIDHQIKKEREAWNKK